MGSDVHLELDEKGKVIGIEIWNAGKRSLIKQTAKATNYTPDTTLRSQQTKPYATKEGKPTKSKLQKEKLKKLKQGYISTIKNTTVTK